MFGRCGVCFCEGVVFSFVKVLDVFSFVFYEFVCVSKVLSSLYIVLFDFENILRVGFCYFRFLE